MLLNNDSKRYVHMSGKFAKNQLNLHIFDKIILAENIMTYN